MRGLPTLTGCLVALLLGATHAPAQTNATASAASPPAKKLTDLERADECAGRIDEFIERLTGLEEQARATNQLSRADCVHVRLVRLEALREVVKGAHDQFAEEHDEESDATELTRSRLEMACARAAQIAREAEDCVVDKSAQPPLKKRRPTAIAVDVDEEPTRPVGPVRDETTCLHQEQLAAMLAKAIELKTTPELSASELSKLAIEPLGGWRAGKCVTLDDFSVAVARALNLHIENPSDPASYTQALREFGLPVDTVLPARPLQGNAPMLLEPEVRAFFKHGLAGPLQSSQPLFPD